MISGQTFDSIVQVSEPQSGKPDETTGVSPWQGIRNVFYEREHKINWQYFAGILSKEEYITGEEREDVFMKILLAGHYPSPGISDEATIKAYYLEWRNDIVKYVYLRRLPSPYFEYALAFMLFLEICWCLAKFTVRLPIGDEPSTFKSWTACTVNRRLVKTRKGTSIWLFDCL